MELNIFSFYFILSQNCQVGAVVPILQMRKLRFRIRKETRPGSHGLEEARWTFPRSA